MLQTKVVQCLIKPLKMKPNHLTWECIQCYNTCVHFHTDFVTLCSCVYCTCQAMLTHIVINAVNAHLLPSVHSNSNGRNLSQNFYFTTCQYAVFQVKDVFLSGFHHHHHHKIFYAVNRVAFRCSSKTSLSVCLHCCI